MTLNAATDIANWCNLSSVDLCVLVLFKIGSQSFRPNYAGEILDPIFESNVYSSKL